MMVLPDDTIVMECGIAIPTNEKIKEIEALMKIKTYRGKTYNYVFLKELNNYVEHLLIESKNERRN